MTKLNDAAIPATLIRVVGKMDLSLVSVDPKEMFFLLEFASDLSDRDGS